MTTDLEAEIRDALHARAAAVTPDRLRTARAAAPRRPRGRRPPGWVLAAASIAVALVAIGVGVLSGSGPDSPTAGGPGDALRDTRWRVVAVTDHGSRQAITSRRVIVDFYGNGDLGASDTINYSSGHWRAAADGVRITGVGTTLAAYGGSDPAVLAAIRGIQALTSTAAQPVRAVLDRGHDGNLRLTAGAVVLDLVRDGRPQPVSPGAQSSPT